MATSLHSSKDIYLLMKTLLEQTMSLDISKMHNFALAKEELFDIQQDITSLISSYHIAHSQELENDD
jgi:hypothetical protein